jgi:hypothetical protein
MTPDVTSTHHWRLFSSNHDTLLLFARGAAVDNLGHVVFICCIKHAAEFDCGDDGFDCGAQTMECLNSLFDL